MVRSDAATVDAYLKSLPDDRRATISAVREVVLAHLPPGYVEVMNWGMITYEIPLDTYPDTYNKKPLMFAALASQKNHCAIYLCNVYQDPKLEARLVKAFEKAGKKLDMGKSCVRFRQADDLPLAAIGKLISATPVRKFIKTHEAARKK